MTSLSRSRCVALLIPCLIAIAPVRLSADTTSAPGLWETFSQDITASLETSLGYFTLPARMTPSGAVGTLVGIGGTVGLISTDDQTLSWISTRNKLHSRPMSDILRTAKHLGDNTVATGIAVTTFATGLFLGMDELRTTGRLIGESLILSGITTTVMKTLLGRARPDSYPDHPTGVWDFNVWEVDDSRNAMPSGHTTAAFAIASVVAYRGDHWAVSIASYSLAALTAIERVQSRRHWLADVTLAGAVGTLTGLYVCERENEKTETPRKESRLIVYPRGTGLGLAYEF